MRILLLCSLAIVGCGSVEVTPDPPRAGGAPCVTSFGCPAGERCDDGKCVADAGCPGPVAPRLLAESDEAFRYPYISSANEHEYLYWSWSEKSGPESELSFVDLASGATSVLPHSPGVAGCTADFRWCVVSTTDGMTTVLAGLTLDASGQVWSAATSHDLPPGYTIIGEISPGGDGVLTGFNKPDVRTFNLTTGESTPLFDLDGRTAMRVVKRPSGTFLTAYTNSLMGGTTASFAPLNAEAAWTTILTTPEAFKTFWAAVPSGSDWFLVGDFLPSAIPQVWRVNATGTQKVGSSDDPMIPVIASRYSSGDPVLDGSRGTGLVCGGGTCQSARLDLATLERTPIGSLVLPGVDRASVIQERWLACDTVDATVMEVIFPPPGTAGNATGVRLHAVRVVPGVTP